MDEIFLYEQEVQVIELAIDSMGVSMNLVSTIVHYLLARYGMPTFPTSENTM